MYMHIHTCVCIYMYIYGAAVYICDSGVICDSDSDSGRQVLVVSQHGSRPLIYIYI